MGVDGLTFGETEVVLFGTYEDSLLGADVAHEAQPEVGWLYDTAPQLPDAQALGHVEQELIYVAYGLEQLVHGLAQVVQGLAQVVQGL